MKSLPSLLLFCLLSFSCFSQKEEKKKEEPKSERSIAEDAQRINLYQQMLNQTQSGNREGIMTTIDLRYEGTIGTPMLSNEWLKGEVVFTDGKRTKEVTLKYNLITKEILLLRSKGDSIAIYPYQLSGFIINDTKNNISFPFVKFDKFKTEAGLLPTTFLLPFYQGKTSFYKHLSKKFVKASYKGAYSVDVRYDSYEDNSEYFIFKNGGEIVKVKIKKSDILEVLADKKTEIESFIKKEKINFKQDTDVSKVLAFYDSL